MVVFHGGTMLHDLYDLSFIHPWPITKNKYGVVSMSQFFTSPNEKRGGASSPTDMALLVMFKTQQKGTFANCTMAITMITPDIGIGHLQPWGFYTVLPYNLDRFFLPKNPMVHRHLIAMAGDSQLPKFSVVVHEYMIYI